MIWWKENNWWLLMGGIHAVVLNHFHQFVASVFVIFITSSWFYGNGKCFNLTFYLWNVGSCNLLLTTIQLSVMSIFNICIFHILYIISITILHSAQRIEAACNSYKTCVKNHIFLTIVINLNKFFVWIPEVEVLMTIQFIKRKHAVTHLKVTTEFSLSWALNIV